MLSGNPFPQWFGGIFVLLKAEEECVPEKPRSRGGCLFLPKLANRNLPPPRSELSLHRQNPKSAFSDVMDVHVLVLYEIYGKTSPCLFNSHPSIHPSSLAGMEIFVVRLELTWVGRVASFVRWKTFFSVENLFDRRDRFIREREKMRWNEKFAAWSISFKCQKVNFVRDFWRREAKETPRWRYSITNRGRTI